MDLLKPKNIVNILFNPNFRKTKRNEINSRKKSHQDEMIPTKIATHLVGKRSKTKSVILTSHWFKWGWFKDVNTLIKRIFCNTLVMRAVDKKLNNIKIKSLRAQVRSEIVHFHRSVDETSTIVVARLLIQKWRSIKNQDFDNLCDYFQTMAKSKAHGLVYSLMQMRPNYLQRSRWLTIRSKQTVTY